MAWDWTMKQAEERIIKAVEDYASSRDWASGDYRLFLRTNDRVGRIHIILVARVFPGDDEEAKWLGVRKELNTRLSDFEGLADSINLTLRTFDQLEEGGIYSPGSSFLEIANL